MKQRPSEASVNPSKLCRLLFLVFALKVAVVGVMLFDPVAAEFSRLFLGKPLSEQQAVVTPGVAHAANAAGAPPAVTPSVAGNNAASSTEAAQGTSTQPATMPAQSSVPSARALPPIGAKKETPAANATVQNAPDVNKDMLSRKQEELARKEQELRNLEGQLNDKLQRMELLENRLGIMMKEAETANDAKFRHLVDVLSNMKAKSAAQVLETLDQRIAVKVLAGMRGRQAGEILTFVKPEIAASLTSALTRMQLPME